MFDDSCYMEPLHLAGRLIMENGGETCRVEETVLRMGHAFGFREVECFAVPSGLFVSYRKSDGTIETAVKRIRRKGIDLTRIDEVNAISRHLEQEKMSCQEVLSQLKAVERRPSRLSPLQMAGAAAMSTAGWSLMFGGGVWDMVTAFFVGLLIEWVTLLMDKFHMKRGTACITMFIIALLLAVPSSLGFGAWSNITILGFDFLDFFDFISNSVLMPIAAFLTCLFVGYIIKPKVIVDEVESSGEFKRKSLFLIMVKYIAPICIVAILVFSVLEGLGFITV